MKQTVDTLVHKLRVVAKTKVGQYAVYLGLFGIVGVVALAASHAGTHATNQEAENGTPGTCTTKVNDDTASSGFAIKLGTCSSDPNDPTNLVATGVTVPDTSYQAYNNTCDVTTNSACTHTIFVATNGVDSNSGTKAAPVKTLSAAIALVPSNETPTDYWTIVVRAGIYRGGEINTSKYFTLQAYPHEQVWFDGTQTIATDSWTPDPDNPGYWYADWERISFCGGHYYDAPYNQQRTVKTCSWGETQDANGNWGNSDYGTGTYAAATDPQMLFVDGTYTHEVTSLSDVGTGSADFFYDQMGTRRLYIHFDPAGHTLDATRWANALQLQNTSAAGKMIIRGVGFRRYADDINASNKTHGGVLIQMPHSVVENDTFTQMAGTGLTELDPAGSTIVNHSIFAFNGFDGIESNGHATSGGSDGIVVQNSVFNSNNFEQYGCGYACGIANLKLDHMVGATVSNNIFENGKGGAKGFWCDDGCTAIAIVNNVMSGNGSHGLFYEVSDTGIIASNLIYGNGGYGIKLGSADTKVYNNTLVNNNVNLMVYDDPRTPKSGVGPNTTNDSVVNNIFYVSNGRGPLQALNLKSSGATNAAESFFTAINYNAYYRASGSPSTLANWQATNGTTNYLSAAAFNTATGFDANSIDITSGGDPFFTCPPNTGYTLCSNSSAYHTATTIPDDVAAALGITQKTGQSRGAISWPGQ